MELVVKAALSRAAGILALSCFLLLQAQSSVGQVTPIGGEFQVNTYTFLEQQYSSVAMDGGGGFLVVWSSRGSDGTDNSGMSIQARFYDSTGLPDGPELQVNTYTPNFQADPQVSWSPHGRFLVTWSSQGSAGTDDDNGSVQARLLDADGSPLTDEFQVNTTTIGSQYLARVGTDAAGQFVVAWSDERDPKQGLYKTVQARRFDQDGAPIGSEFLVPSGTLERKPWAVVPDATDGFLVIFDGAVPADDHLSLFGRRFDATGTPVGNDFQVNALSTGINSWASAAPLAGGGFAVVWHSDESAGSDSDGFSVQGRLLDAEGGPVGTGFQVNTYTTESQLFPAVAGTADGGFVVTWTSDGSDGPDVSSTSVRAQRYRAGGQPLGSELQINTYSTGAQVAVKSIASNLEGELVVTWHSFGSSGTDTSNFSVQAQRYADLFLDGFESGDEGRWSSAVQTSAATAPVLELDHGRPLAAIREP